MPFRLESTAFGEGEAIPKRHACDGEDLSPPLKWSDPPAGTKSFALVCEDPDAPVMTWVHWVMYAIPASTLELSEGLPAKETLGDGSKQGLNSWKRTGYGGPCPPGKSTHRYFFRLYALDIVPDVRPSEGRKGLERAITGHILGQTELMGRYTRQ